MFEGYLSNFIEVCKRGFSPHHGDEAAGLGSQIQRLVFPGCEPPKQPTSAYLTQDMECLLEILQEADSHRGKTADHKQIDPDLLKFHLEANKSEN